MFLLFREENNNSKGVYRVGLNRFKNVRMKTHHHLFPFGRCLDGSPSKKKNELPLDYGMCFLLVSLKGRKVAGVGKL